MKLRVWHIPQIPMDPFYVYTEDIKEAKKICDILAAYDLFQLENKVKPDFINTNGIEMWDNTNKEWVDWYLETEEDYFDDVDNYLEEDIDIKKFSDKLFSQLNLKGV